MVLKTGTRFKFHGFDEIWRVLLVNESRAHCVSESREQVTLGARTFQATSRKTTDISPNADVEVLTEMPGYREVTTPPPTRVPTSVPAPRSTTYVLAFQDRVYLRRLQTNKDPGFRYDPVERPHATCYKTLAGATRALHEYQQT